MNMSMSAAIPIPDKKHDTQLDIFSDFITDNTDNTFHKILTDLIDKNNVEMKTEIDNPLALAQLKTIALALKKEGFEDAGNAIDDFIQWFLTYMVSHNRKSRTEIVAALTEGIKAERTLGEKLTSPPE